MKRPASSDSSPKLSRAARYALFVALIFLAHPPRLEAARMLTLEDCLKMADENHPNLAGASAQVVVERGRLSQSAAGDRLTVSGTAAAERSGTSDGESSGYSLGVSANLKVFDANRGRYLTDAQRKTLASAEENARDALFRVHVGVKSAYMALILSVETANQRLESVNVYARHLEQAQGFFDVGSKPWYDVTKAKVDLGKAELALIEARGNVELSKRELLNAMGVTLDEDFNVEPASLEPPWQTEGELDTLALEHRADYKAAELKILAGRSAVSAEARGLSPTLSVVGGYSASGKDVFDLDRGWNTGVKLAVPLVDGGVTRARVETARGQLLSLEAARNKLRQDILLDVGRAVIALNKAREGLRVSTLTLESAEENCRIAEGRYETGVGAPLEVADAFLSLTEARLASHAARYNLQMAIISLESAVGVEFRAR